jgi:hypothetical protein
VRLEVSPFLGLFGFFRLSVSQRMSSSGYHLCRCKYSDGVLVPLSPGSSAEPSPAAGNQGTTITVSLSLNLYTTFQNGYKTKRLIS